MSATNVVAEDWKDVDPKIWTPAHIAILKAAATDKEVERVLVNPAIKKALCRDVSGDRVLAAQSPPGARPQLSFPRPHRLPGRQDGCKPQPPRRPTRAAARTSTGGSPERRAPKPRAGSTADQNVRAAGRLPPGAAGGLTPPGRHSSLNARASCHSDSDEDQQRRRRSSASRAGMCLTAQPPNGAAIMPPITSGTRFCSGAAPSSMKNVVAAATVTKNSVALTEPTVWRGAWPEPTSVDVVTGPQPPPPLASRKPATKPTGAIQPAGASRKRRKPHRLEQNVDRPSGADSRTRMDA